MPRPLATMASTCEVFASMGRTSARFAALLVHAGALTALERVATLAARQSGYAAGPGAGAQPDDAFALTDGVFINCLSTFGRSVPRVSRPGQGCQGFEGFVEAAWWRLRNRRLHMRHLNAAQPVPVLSLCRCRPGLLQGAVQARGKRLFHTYE